jgi:hypothetical protein
MSPIRIAHRHFEILYSIYPPVMLKLLRTCSNPVFSVPISSGDVIFSPETRHNTQATEGRMTHNNVWKGANGLNHIGTQVFDTVPLILLQPVPRARPPQVRYHEPVLPKLRCHQV